VHCELFIDIFYPLLFLLLFVCIRILLLNYIYTKWLHCHATHFLNMFFPPPQKKKYTKSRKWMTCSTVHEFGLFSYLTQPREAWNAKLNILFSLSDLCGLLSAHCLPKSHKDRSLVLLVLVTEEVTIFGK